MVTIIWKLDLSMQSTPLTTEVINLIPAIWQGVLDITLSLTRPQNRILILGANWLKKIQTPIKKFSSLLQKCVVPLLL
jgi:hypothetical protein